MTVYAPTVNPGDERRRTRFIGIRLGVNEPPIIDVLEQDVIRTKDGTERILEDLGSLPHNGFVPSETFPILDPSTDAPVGLTATMGDTMALVYSWVRYRQTIRDDNLSQ